MTADKTSNLAAARLAGGLVLALAFLFFFGAGASRAASSARAHDLVVYHTNDAHGHALAETDSRGRPLGIGYDRVRARADADPSARKLLLDAGDVLHGQALATTSKGELIARILSLVGYDALAVGNHDFDYGRERFLYLAKKYRLNFLAANVRPLPGGPPFPLAGWLVKDFGDLKVGVFGLSTPQTVGKTSPGNVDGLEFADPAAAARETVGVLKAAGADLIVAVTHLGSEPDCPPMSLTVAREAPGIDLIVDGHSHSEIARRVKNSAGSTLVVSAGAHLENLGRVTFDRQKDGRFLARAELLTAGEAFRTPPDPALREALAVVSAELDEELSRIVMTLPMELGLASPRAGGTDLGRLVCAAAAEETGADVVLINGGAIRGSLPEGAVSRGRLLSALPFSNKIYLLEVSGADLLAALENGFKKPGSGAWPQFWGLEVSLRERRPKGSAAGERALESVRIGGEEVLPDRTYKLAVNDFMHSGGDGYAMLGRYDHRDFGPLEDALSRFVGAGGPEKLRAIAATENFRIVR